MDLLRDFFDSVFCFTGILLSKRDLAILCIGSAMYFGVSGFVEISGSTSGNCKVSIFSSSETGRLFSLLSSTDKDCNSVSSCSIKMVLGASC